MGIILDGTNGLTLPGESSPTIGFTGFILPFGGSTAPAGWLECNGQAVSRTTYAALFTAIGTTWGVGDNSTTFNVPDLRESAPVGAGTFAAVTGTTHGAVTASDSYTVGQFKDDQIQGHYHQFWYDTYKGGSGTTGVYHTSGQNAFQNNVIQDPYSDGTNGTPRKGTVTRGKRIGVLFCIKY